MKKKWTIDNIKLARINRELIPTHIARLEESIRKHGYISGAPIIVDPEGYIIDGQHRFMACKNLKVNPEIIEADVKDIIPILNSTQATWATRDYVHYYAEQGIEDYILLNQICKKKGISPKVAEAIITGKSAERQSVRRVSTLSPLKAGAFRIPDKSDKGLAKLERKINAIMNIVALLGLPKTERLVLAITRLAEDKNFSFAVFETKINYQRSKIYRCTTINEFKIMLSTIYNYKNSKKVAV